MFRFLSKRFARSFRNRQPKELIQTPTDNNVLYVYPPNGKCSSDNLIHCKIMLLDGTHLTVYVYKKAKGVEIFENLCNHIDLRTETDYFGLQFTDHSSVQHWLDYTKSIRKQVKIGPPYTFHLRVKFYSSDPNYLKDEYARYLFFLQLKQDIQTGKLPCSRETAAKLSALALQSEFGDHDPDSHDEAFISEFRFIPDQDEALEQTILEEWQALRPSPVRESQVLL